MSFIEAIGKGGAYPCIVNGANEEAVKHFLNGKIGFLDIGKLAESSVESFSYREITSYEDVIEIDKAARDFVNSRVN